MRGWSPKDWTQLSADRVPPDAPSPRLSRVAPRVARQRHGARADLCRTSRILLPRCLPVLPVLSQGPLEIEGLCRWRTVCSLLTPRLGTLPAREPPSPGSCRSVVYARAARETTASSPWTSSVSGPPRHLRCGSTGLGRSSVTPDKLPKVVFDSVHKQNASNEPTSHLRPTLVRRRVHPRAPPLRRVLLPCPRPF